MSHDGTATNEAVIVQLHRTGLPKHFPQCGACIVKIILCGGVFAGGIGIDVLQIGQIDLDFTLEALQIFDLLIAAAVPNHGNRQSTLQGLADRPGEVGGIDQVDVVYALFDQFKVDTAQTFDADSLSKSVMGDGIILTESAAKRATAEENGA